MKKITKMAAVAALLITFLAASSVTAQEWTEEQKEVWKVVQDRWEAWEKGDFDGFATNIHDNYHGWSHERALPVSKEKMIKSFADYKDIAKMTYYDIEPARIKVTENTAVVHYYFSYQIAVTMDEEKTNYDFKGKNAEFFLKTDGKWMLTGDMTFW